MYAVWSVWCCCRGKFFRRGLGLRLGVFARPLKTQVLSPAPNGAEPKEGPECPRHEASDPGRLSGTVGAAGLPGGQRAAGWICSFVWLFQRGLELRGLGVEVWVNKVSSRGFGTSESAIFTASKSMMDHGSP